MIPIPFLAAQKPEEFPPVETALREPNGLLAAGGDLSPERLLAAYRRGIFPWYSRGQPILWWSPDPRTVFPIARLHAPRRFARWLPSCEWTVRADTAFDAVVHACAAPRAKQRGTWIDASMRAAYQRLHALGHAHSIEAWDGEALVGGIYGIAIGRMFFGESMFSTADNGSKVALFALAQALRAWNFPLIDAQVASPHLFTLGAIEMKRSAFCIRVSELISAPGIDGSWRERFPVITPAEIAAGLG